MQERQNSRPRLEWLDAPPSEWPDSARRFYNLCALAAERILQRERDAAKVQRVEL